MVENFTTVNESTYEDVVKEGVSMVEEMSMKENIREGLHTIKKEPSQKTIENILNYSKSLRK